MDGPANDWQEGPSLVESIQRYKWLVISAVLIGAAVGFIWSSQQPVRYEGVVRLFLDTGQETGADPGRVVRSQAQYLLSPTVLNQVVARTDGQLTRKELEKRLTVEPARDADLITIRALGATPEEAAGLANSVVASYRQVVADQANDAARQAVAALTRRQQQLEGEIAALDERLRANPGSPRLEANRDAKIRQLNDLADQSEDVRRDAARAGRAAERGQEEAAIPDERAQPKPLRSAAIGALLALVAAAALAWWLHGRGMADLRLLSSVSQRTGGLRPELTASAKEPSPEAFRPDGRHGSMNGSPSGNGSASGIADFDQVATSVQQLFRSLDGPPRKLYEKNLPHMVVEQIAQSFPVDLAVILLKTDEGVRTMGSVGPEAVSDGALDQAAWELIDDAASSGPRLVYLDELQSLAGTGLEAEEDVSLALVPLVRDQVGFGVLLTGRRQNGAGDAAQLGDEEVEQIAGAVYDMVPYLWAWLLLRSLKARLGTFH